MAIPWPFWPWPGMKPERIQVWLRQLGELLIEISEGITGEAETPENAE